MEVTGLAEVMFDRLRDDQDLHRRPQEIEFSSGTPSAVPPGWA
jgi:hypothetical protein